MRARIAHPNTLNRLAWMTWGIAALVVMLDLALSVRSLGLLIGSVAAAATLTICARQDRHASRQQAHSEELARQQQAQTESVVRAEIRDQQEDLIKIEIREQFGELAAEIYEGRFRHKAVNRIEAAGGVRPRVGGETGPFQAIRP